MSEKTASDAPVWYSAEAASAWADGFNAATEQRCSADSAQPYGWHAAANGLFSVDPRCAEVWRHHMGLDVIPVYTRAAPADEPQASADSAELEARLALADELMLPGGTHPYLGARKRDMIVAALRGRAQPQTAPSLGEIASIIRPDAFDGTFNGYIGDLSCDEQDTARANEQDAKNEALAKADAILSTFGRSQAVSAPTRTREDQLWDRRNELQNSYGNGPYGDGLITQKIAEIDKELAALSRPLLSPTDKANGSQS